MDEIQRTQSIKDNQQKALDQLKEEQNKTFERDQVKTTKDRLHFLLQQSEIYSHFMSKNYKGNTEIINGSTKRDSRSEREEDEELMNNNNKNTIDESELIRNSPDWIKGTELKEYQIDGLNWLIKLYKNGINGILADEMGLGKTIQTISLLGYLKSKKGIKGPHLIIVPKSTITNWMIEINKWCPILNPIKLHGNKEERNEIKNNIIKLGKFEICLTTYEIAVIEKSILKKINWNYIIIDEAHRIKNEVSVLSQVVRQFNTLHRLLITGTPLQNDLKELWSLLNFLLPEIFASSQDFEKWFDLSKNQEEDKQQEIIEKLHKVLQPFLLRRLKSEVEISLLPKKEIKIFVPLSKMQRLWYQKILIKDIDTINSTILNNNKNKDTNNNNNENNNNKNNNNNNKGGNKIGLLNIAMQLRKVCNHPYLFEGAEPTPHTTDYHLIYNSGKLLLLDKLLFKLKNNGSRVLLFSQMTRVLDILEDYAIFRNFEYCRIDGNTASDIRQLNIDEFNNKNSTKFLFLLSTRAGGLGINLATADTVVIYDSDWNPQNDLQAISRAHRIGQTKSVVVYRLITEHTIEEKMIERAERKLYLDAVVIQQGRLVNNNNSITKQECLEMIKFGADEIFKTNSTINDNEEIERDNNIITEEELDLLIQRGVSKSNQITDKIKQTTNNLANFSINSMFRNNNNNSDNKEVDIIENNNKNVYEFEGVDYSKPIKIPTHYLDKSEENNKRERRSNVMGYGIDDYYRNVLQIETKRNYNSDKKIIRTPKQLKIFDFQFYPPKLYKLIDTEISIYKVSYLFILIFFLISS